MGGQGENTFAGGEQDNKMDGKELAIRYYLMQLCKEATVLYLVIWE